MRWITLGAAVLVCSVPTSSLGAPQGAKPSVNPKYLTAEAAETAKGNQISPHPRQMTAQNLRDSLSDFNQEASIEKIKAKSRRRFRAHFAMSRATFLASRFSAVRARARSFLKSVASVPTVF